MTQMEGGREKSKRRPKYKHVNKQGAQHHARTHLNCSRLDSFCGICLALDFKWQSDLGKNPALTTALEAATAQLILPEWHCSL